ncbi:MAG: formylmethanofuran--tetrahydromethanopterin N-formyltransferase [Planctomycetaceae bacterium]|nr:formylmethanofuran--tetrahydromethanopterin N-formyltransferase [Planctomycetaceae bacterium]
MLTLNQVEVVDTFAEAFPMAGARVVITADSPTWAETAAREFCGYASSVIGCDAEAAVERAVPPEETPDGRPGISVLAFAFNTKGLAKALVGRVGQNVLTCPTTACYDGLADEMRTARVPVGGALRYFGDGLQSSKKLSDRRYWRIPVMDGEFVCEDRFRICDGVGGGNLILCGTDARATLAAAEAAAAAARDVPDAVLPFPGGIVRSGSKVGSRYPQLRASTNDPYCPTVRALTDSALPVDCQCVYELVIDGLSFAAVQKAMRAGLHAAAACSGVLRITAGNYGGKLGRHHFHLRELL